MPTCGDGEKVEQVDLTPHPSCFLPGLSSVRRARVRTLRRPALATLAGTIRQVGSTTARIILRRTSTGSPVGGFDAHQFRCHSSKRYPERDESGDSWGSTTGSEERVRDRQEPPDRDYSSLPNERSRAFLKIRIRRFTAGRSNQVCNEVVVDDPVIESKTARPSWLNHSASSSLVR